MTVTGQIFRKVTEVSIPHFFMTVESSISGTEMPEYIEPFPREGHKTILHGASERRFTHKGGGWRLIFTFFPTDRIVDGRYALENKVQVKNRS